MTFRRQFLHTIAKNPISLFAVLCVACTAAFLGWLTYRLLKVIESPSWCSSAIQADRITPGKSDEGLTTCVKLLEIQLQAVATGFHISTGGFVFVLVVLIVVVVAGAKASGKLPGGLEFDVSRQAADAADHVVEGAEQAAAEVKK